MYLKDLRIVIPEYIQAIYPGQWRLDLELYNTFKNAKEPLVTLQVFMEVKIID